MAERNNRYEKHYTMRTWNGSSYFYQKGSCISYSRGEAHVIVVFTQNVENNEGG